MGTVDCGEVPGAPSDYSRFGRLRSRGRLAAAAARWRGMDGCAAGSRRASDRPRVNPAATLVVPPVQATEIHRTAVTHRGADDHNNGDRGTVEP